MHRLFIIFILLSSFLGTVIAADETEHAKNPQIPELKEMHHAIHPMWHDAYPNKDIDQLKALYPELKDYFQKLEAAEFPAEWPDKAMHWQEGINGMSGTLKEYKTAMDNNNTEELLNAARKLHDDFENLVMIINPPIPELDEFHQILFHVYHDYLPEKNWKEVKASVDKFKMKVEALEKAELPKWMSETAEDFRNATEELGKAVNQLAELTPDNDDSEWEERIEKVHDAYVNLASTME